MLGRGLSPSRFVALLDEFRHKIQQERIAQRLQELQQDELIALVKLQAEIKARYLVAVLDMVNPKISDVEAQAAEAKRCRELAEEIDKGVAAIVDGVVKHQIMMPGVEFGPEFSPDIQRAIDEFIATKQDWDE